MTKQLVAAVSAALKHPAHAERLAVRLAKNGKPNGYKPVTEAELEAEKFAEAA